MTLTGRLSIAASLLVLACSRMETPPTAGGGFETGELQVLVVNIDGSPSVAAKVWILLDSGDTAPPQVLDSSVTGSTGTSVVSRQERASGHFGVEAWSGDTLAGILRAIDGSQSDTIRIQLAAVRRIRLSCAEYEGMELFQPGSRLLQPLPSPCVDSFEVKLVGRAGVIIARPTSPPYRPKVINLSSL